MAWIDVEGHAVYTVFNNTIGKGRHALGLAFFYPGLVRICVPLNQDWSYRKPHRKLSHSGLDVSLIASFFEKGISKKTSIPIFLDKWAIQEFFLIKILYVLAHFSSDVFSVASP